MSDFDISLAKTLANEGGFFHNLQTDEVVNRGITVWFLRSRHILNGTGKATPEELTYVKSLSLQETSDLYRTYFWTPGNFAALTAQLLADKAFDLGVNLGLNTAIELLQAALNQLRPDSCKVDGELGPLTATACNTSNASELYSAFISEAEVRYRQIATNTPALAGDLPGWLIRLHKP